MLPYLPPAPADVTITYILEAAKMPYLTEFFLATRREGENRHEFAKRRILREAYQWWTAKVDNETRELERAERESRAAEIETFKNS